jgi:hypothetical protein
MLSKTRYSAGLQCPLRLWFACYNPELASETSPVKQALFDTGHQVGVLATGLFPGGVLVEEDHLHHEKAVQTTLRAMGDPRIKAIYEAGFFCNGVRVRADILERLENGSWNLIEVKSSTYAWTLTIFQRKGWGGRLSSHFLFGETSPISRVPKFFA